MWNIKRKITVQCHPGLPPFAANELRSLGFPVTEEANMHVVTEGTLHDCMYLNLHLRTGNRILWEMGSFELKDSEGLYKNVFEMPWETVIPNDGYFSIHSFAKHESINDTRYPNLKAKDAIVDRIKSKTGRRPDSGNDFNETVVYFFWNRENCTVYIDTSGETISKHTYRKMPFKAPVAEPLAAAIVQATEWSPSIPLINPMCGSGTIAIEAALKAANIAPGLNRHNFGFKHLIGFDNNAWKTMLASAKSKVNVKINVTIIGSDRDMKALQAARTNAAEAGVASMIKWELCPYENTTLPDGEGIIILNPEYGERMGEESELEAVYKGIGDFFKQRCQGKRGFIFTGNLNLIKKVGLRSSAKWPFFNAKIDSRLVAYDMYEGSKKN
jgi:23S rRNA G2445 N2-methylase RlmL